MKTSPYRPASLLILLPLLLFAVVANAPAPASETVQGVEMIVIPVQGQVYMLQTPAAGGNIGVLPGPEGVLLVDDQVPRLTESVIQGVREISDEEIRFVINTHVHIDHQGGNEALANMGATLVAHDNVRLWMLERLRTPRGGGRISPAPPEGARPLLTFDNAVTFHMNGEEVRAFLVPPAHTDGDSFVYFADSDVLHTGDVFRTNMYPIIDVYNGGSVSGMIGAMEIAIGMSGPNTKIIPGHGFGFTDRDGLIEVLGPLTGRTSSSSLKKSCLGNSPRPSARNNERKAFSPFGELGKNRPSAATNRDVSSARSIICSGANLRLRLPSLKTRIRS